MINNISDHVFSINNYLNFYKKLNWPSLSTYRVLSANMKPACGGNGLIKDNSTPPLLTCPSHPMRGRCFAAVKKTSSPKSWTCPEASSQQGPKLLRSEASWPDVQNTWASSFDAAEQLFEPSFNLSFTRGIKPMFAHRKTYLKSSKKILSQGYLFFSYYETFH